MRVASVFRRKFDAGRCLPPEGGSHTLIDVMRLPVLALAACVPLISCATGGAPPPADVAENIRSRTGASVRLGTAGTPAIPAGIQVDDGLSRDEAVAIALVEQRRISGQREPARLRARGPGRRGHDRESRVIAAVSRGDRSSSNATLRWPVEVLWERPKRVAAARLSVESAAQALVQSGLDLALAVRLAYADLALAMDRQRLAGEAAATLQRIDLLTQSRLAAGDIAALDARAARVDAVRSALRRRACGSRCDDRPRASAPAARTRRRGSVARRGSRHPAIRSAAASPRI